MTLLVIFGSASAFYCPPLRTGPITMLPTSQELYNIGVEVVIVSSYFGF